MMNCGANLIPRILIVAEATQVNQRVISESAATGLTRFLELVIKS